MRKLTIACCLVFIFAQCKKTNTTNNFITTEHLAAFTVDGLHDVQLSTDRNYANLSLSINYQDSAQQKVKMSITDLPVGITMKTSGPTEGYPTFTTAIAFYDTSTVAPATPGDYMAILMLEGENSGVKRFPFKVTVEKVRLCADKYAGIFNYCKATNTGSTYADTLSLDPAITNKVWMSNFANLGTRVYAFYSCDGGRFRIPEQTVAGAKISGTGTDLNNGAYNLVFNLTIESANVNVYMNY